ncbi:MAG: ABC transporter substrate-binding protein [Clostridia bacterium]|nr:ABC transporter substrate-binding protein [Clostridia bacterium]
MKKVLSIILAVSVLLSLVLLSGCGSENKNKPTIGIIQFGTHESLNNCYNGIVKGLEEKINLDDYNVEYVNSNFTAETSLSQANKLVNSKAKVIIAIATPSAIAAANAATGKDVPVVYCAVTDASTVANFENMTGTSDIPDFEAQLKLVSAFFNKTDVKIGVLSSTEESSDDIQIKNLREAAKKYSGMEIIVEKVADITTVDAKVNSLVSKKVDCFVNLLDSTIVGKLQNILAITDKAGIPVFGSEIEQVKNGCLAAASIDYVTVGKLAGEQAAEIIGGKNVSEVAPKTMENETFPCFNSSVVEKFSNIKVPADYKDLKDVIEK